MVLGTVLIAAILLAGPLYKLYWLMTTRSHPRTQETAPDLSAFQRGTGNGDTAFMTAFGHTLGQRPPLGTPIITGGLRCPQAKGSEHPPLSAATPFRGQRQPVRCRPRC